MNVPEKGGNALGYPILTLFEKRFILQYTVWQVFVRDVYARCITGLAGGADAAYIFEEKFGVQDLIKVTK
jgi:hypothetical protein